MIKKIIALIILIFALYGVSIFLLPQVASQIDTIIGMPWFSEKVRGNKVVMEGAITDIPSVNEFKSWALDAKDTFLNGVDVTKQKIDTLREWAQKAEETYNQAKDTYDSLKETLSGATQTIEEIGDVIESVNNVTIGTGN